MPDDKTRKRWGPFKSLTYAEGFADGIEFSASFLGDFEGDFPEVTGEAYQEPDGVWWVPLSYTREGENDG